MDELRLLIFRDITDARFGSLLVCNHLCRHLTITVSPEIYSRSAFLKLSDQRSSCGIVAGARSAPNSDHCEASCPSVVKTYPQCCGHESIVKSFKGAILRERFVRSND
jgi:hypothetical protein